MLIQNRQPYTNVRYNRIAKVRHLGRTAVLHMAISESRGPVADFYAINARFYITFVALSGMRQ